MKLGQNYLKLGCKEWNAPKVKRYKSEQKSLLDLHPVLGQVSVLTLGFIHTI